MQDKFLKDVQIIYDHLSEKKKEVNKLYEFLEKNQFEKLEIIDEMARKLDLEMSEDLRVALVSRLVSLRDDSFVQVLKKENLAKRKS